MGQPLNWRYVTEGSKVWVCLRSKWYMGVIDKFGPNKQEDTNLTITLMEHNIGKSVKRRVSEVFSRKDDKERPT